MIIHLSQQVNYSENMLYWSHQNKSIASWFSNLIPYIDNWKQDGDDFKILQKWMYTYKNKIPSEKLQMNIYIYIYIYNLKDES